MYSQLQPLSPRTLGALQGLLMAIPLPSGPGGSAMVPVPLAALDPCDVPFTRLHAAWLVALDPSAQIVAHTDQPLPGPRVHIPLATSPDCWSFSDGQWFHLEVGHCYRMDPTVPHGAVNWGATRRVHLLLDLMPE